MAKNLTTRNTKKDLRTAYLHTFDVFSTDPVEVGTVVGGNSRYGRELLATLITGGLVTSDRVNGAEMVWQAVDTYDNTDRKTAEATIDAWLATWGEGASEKPAKAPAPTNLLECRCGCEELANKGREYRPGHDARHAGAVARYALTRDAEERGPIIAKLPSVALQHKAQRMLHNLLAKRDAPKAPRTKVAKDQRQVGTVKVGRWAYPALKDGNGALVRNTKRDGSGKWVSVPDTAAATWLRPDWRADRERRERDKTGDQAR